MFNEILKIVPKVDGNALNKMFNTINARFTRITKNFGKGLVNVGKTAFKGGAAVAGVTMLIDKFLNPLKETQDAIERALGVGASITDYSEQFNTTQGNLFKLQKLAQAKGVDEQALYMMISRFQGAVVDAKADPNKVTSVRQYTNVNDYAEGFFRFIQNLQTMSKDDQLRVQTEIFGEKQTLKNAAFLNETNFNSLSKRLGLGDGSKFTGLIDRLDKLDDKNEVAKVREEIRSLMAQGGIINGGMVDQINAGRRRQNEQIEYNMRNFDSMAEMAKAADNINKGIQMLVTSVGSFTMELTKFKEILSSFNLMDMKSIFLEIKNNLGSLIKNAFRR